MSLCDYAAKVRIIEGDSYAVKEFSLSEITEASINMFSARDNLSAWEYKYVGYLYRHYLSDMRVMRLDATSYKSVLIEILASFDIIADVGSYCPDEKTKLCKKEGAEGKAQYRKRAEALINDGQLFSREWWKLCKKYCIEFWY